MRKITTATLLTLLSIFSFNTAWSQANDVGVIAILNPTGGCAEDSTEIKVVVSNLGTNSQNSIGVNVDISGGITTSLSSTISSLAMGANDTIVMGTFNSLPGGTFNFSSYSTLSSDQDNSNDTTKLLSVSMDTIPKIVTTNIPSVCQGSTAFRPTYASPAGGTYSGHAVRFGLFMPDSGTVGSNLIIYEFTDLNNCTDTAMSFIRINALPSTSLMTPSSMCMNDTIIKITGGVPAGGIYEINGVLDSILIPMNLGLDTIKYTYTDANNCTNSSTGFVRIDSVTSATFSPITDACLGGTIVSLTQGAPFGGTYSGNNVSSGSYTPNTIGTDTLTYVFENRNGCGDTITQTITVNALPNVSFSPLSSICENAGNFNLTGGLPTGGVYTGQAVSGGVYSPTSAGAGIDTITYKVTDANNCSNSAVQTIELLAAPSANLSTIAPFCSKGSSRLLNEGTPTGGTYLGTGVSASSFDPSLGSIGNNTISYIASNANCADTATAIISIEATPAFKITGMLTGCGESVPVAKTDIAGMSYLWSTGSTSDSISVKTTGKISVTVTDNSGSANCSATDSADVVYDEECAGIEKYYTDNKVSIFPNPSNGKFILEINDIDETLVTIDVISGNGQFVYSSNKTISGQTLRENITLENVQPGMYLVRIIGEKTYSVERISVNK